MQYVILRIYNDGSRKTDIYTGESPLGCFTNLFYTHIYYEDRIVKFDTLEDALKVKEELDERLKYLANRFFPDYKYETLQRALDTKEIDDDESWAVVHLNNNHFSDINELDKHIEHIIIPYDDAMYEKYE